MLTVTELTLDHEQLDEKAQQYKTEVYVLKGRLSVLVEECDRLKQEADNKIPVTVHTASVNECKRYVVVFVVCACLILTC